MPLSKRTPSTPPPTTKKKVGKPQDETEVDGGGTATAVVDEDETDTGTNLDPDSLVDSIIDEAKDTSNPDVGTYSAIVYQIKLNEPNDKGISIQAELVLYYGHIDENRPIFRNSRFFKMVGDDLRTPDEWGPIFYNQFMAKLGYDKGNRGAAAREEVNDQKPGVTIKVKQNAKNPDFVDVSIVGLLGDDNDDIQAIREEVEKNPW